MPLAPTLASKDGPSGWWGPRLSAWSFQAGLGARLPHGARLHRAAREPVDGPQAQDPGPEDVPHAEGLLESVCLLLKQLVSLLGTYNLGLVNLERHS